MQAFNSTALSALVTPSWLIQRLQQSAVTKRRNVTIIDASWYMPNVNKDGYIEYKQKHIPTARYLNIDDDFVRDKNSQFPHMLPNKKEIGQIEKMYGLEDGIPAVIYENESPTLCASARVWWMIRAFGKQDVFVLNGGMKAWLNEGYDIETDDGGDNNNNDEIETEAEAAAEKNYKRNLVWNMDDILNRNELNDVILDARSEGRFKGIDPEPRKNLSSGHMPSSLNVPSGLLINQDAKTLKSKTELEQIFNERGINIDELKQKKRVVTSCGSGVTAAIVALALFELGVEAAVYDGSWVEYASNHPSNPIVRSQ